MKGFRKLSDQDRAAILALKGQIVSRDVATRYGISSQTVYGIWQGRLIQRAMTKRKKRLTDADRDLIIRMKADGANIREMVEASGFGDSTVLLVIREARAEGDPRLNRSAAVADTTGAGATQSPALSPAPVALPPRMMVKLNDTVRRMRESFKARGMAPDLALREALRIYAGSAVEGGSNSRAAGGVSGSFHGQNMQDNGR